MKAVLSAQTTRRSLADCDELRKSRSGGAAFVPVMHAASTRELYTAWIQRILVQCQLRPRPVVIINERLEVPEQTALVEHDRMIKALATDCANDPFDIGTLPR